MPDPLPPLLQIAAEYRAAVARADAAALNRLIAAYRQMFARLSGKIDALALQIGVDQPTRGQLVRMARYRELMEQVGQELAGMQTLTANEIEQAGRVGIRLGADHARGLISTAATGTPQVAAGFNALPRDAIETMLGFLAPDGPLYSRLGKLAATHAQKVAEAITEGVGLGYNPRKIAAAVQDAFGGGLTDALRFVRTSQLYAYRESARATYLANSDVVQGWIWHADLSPRTCLSCLRMHGTVHSLDERLNDHHNGRCAAIPLLIGQENPVSENAGQEWFEKQSEAAQRTQMGAAKFDAYQAGKFQWAALSGESVDPVYGAMRVERSLKELIGE